MPKAESEKADAERRALVQRFVTHFGERNGIQARILEVKDGAPVDVDQLADEFGLPADFLAEQLTNRRLIASTVIDTDKGPQEVFTRPRHRKDRGKIGGQSETELNVPKIVKQNAPRDRYQPTDDPERRWG